MQMIRYFFLLEINKHDRQKNIKNIGFGNFVFLLEQGQGGGIISNFRGDIARRKTKNYNQFFVF